VKSTKIKSVDSQVGSEINTDTQTVIHIDWVPRIVDKLNKVKEENNTLEIEADGARRVGVPLHHREQRDG